jgi:hypothetical protein
MSKFTVKKIRPPEKDSSQEASARSYNSKKILKYIVGTLIIVVGILFSANLALQSMGNISISKSDVQFTPIIFGTGVQQAKATGTTNILIAGIGGK